MLIKGKAWYARVTGKPHDNKFTKSQQWSFDLSIDKETQQKLLDAGMRKSYLKNKGDDKGTFLQFTRDAVRKDGTAGKPFEVVDAQGHPWDQSRLIGNGSELNVIVTLNERSNGVDKWLKPGCIKLQVWDLVPFQKKSTLSDFPIAPEERSDMGGSADNVPTEEPAEAW